MKYINTFREWNEITGALVKNSSWYFEIESIMDDAYNEGLEQNKKENAQLKEQIKKMRTCGNCKKWKYCFIESDKGLCLENEDWEYNDAED